jgi:hypothetical protein
MPKNSPGSRRRARAEARDGAKYTRVLRRQPSSKSANEHESAPGYTNPFEAVAAQLAMQAQEVRSRIGSAPGVDEIQIRFAAVQAFRSLGHSVDDRPTAVDHAGRLRWQCRMCGSDVQVDRTAGWVSPSCTGRCVHEGTAW